MPPSTNQPVSGSAQTSARPRRHRFSGVPRSTIALLLISIVLPLALFGLAAAQNRRDVLKAAEHRVERTTRILHEHAMKVFETHQLMLDQINERLRGLDWSDETQVAALRGLLMHLRELLPQVADVMVTDASGAVRVSSSAMPRDLAPNLADRDYFRALKASDQALPYVSRGAIGRLSGTPIFTMAVRVKGPVKGAFDGVVAVAIEQGYFRDFYNQAEHEYSHLVILAREDGSVLTSEPPLPAMVLPPRAMFRVAEADASVDATIRPSVVDGVRRIFGYEKIGAYPVVVGFGITRASALLPWARNMWGYGLVAVLSSLALLGVSGFAIRRIALEGRATERWRRSAAQLKTAMAKQAEVEEQLRQAQKMEAVGRLTGGIAHDFNNLLTVVIGSLDMLMRRMKDAEPRHRELVANAIDGATRAAGLTARLLAFSRQQPLDPKPIAVNALIEGMSSMLARTLRETIEIEMKLDPQAGRTLADPNQLENAILNLCVNAVDAMPRGGTLSVATGEELIDAAGRNELAPGRYVRIEIADTGTGMPPEVVARAFEPFFTTKPVGKGTGLGLSQVYGFARQSKGGVEILSEDGRGTSIRIFLPWLERVASAEIVVLPVAAPEQARPASGITILVVEDDELVRGFSVGTLREAGYLVVEAGTGPDGLRLLDAHPEVVLLFTDVVLKGPLNGRELADAVLARRPDLPILFTTGYTPDAIVHGGRLDEGVSLLGKPFTATALVARIGELLSPAPARAEPDDLRRSAAG